MGWGSSKRTTVNEDNRVINDLSGSTFDNSTDSSVSYEDSSYRDESSVDNSYRDESLSFVDNSYSDESIDNTDNSYLDTSSVIDGEYAGNSGSIQITDGGAFTTVDNAVSELVSMGRAAFTLGEISLATMGKTANVSMEQATANSALMRDITETALEQMSAQATSTVSASTNANRQALETSQKLMTTISANGNDLLIDGVVNIAKYGAIGVGSLAVVFGIVKLIGGSK